MRVLSGKKILLGVTAGIAAYKAAFLVRLLVKQGAEVKVVMTPQIQPNILYKLGFVGMSFDIPIIFALYLNKTAVSQAPLKPV